MRLACNREKWHRWRRGPRGVALAHQREPRRHTRAQARTRRTTRKSTLSSLVALFDEEELYCIAVLHPRTRCNKNCTTTFSNLYKVVLDVPQVYW